VQGALIVNGVLAVALQLWIGRGWLKLPAPAFNLAP
jgi:hypothetical protein